MRPNDRTYQTLIDACGDNVEEAEDWVVKRKGEGFTLTMTLGALA
jgi:hypothetical protein